MNLIKLAIALLKDAVTLGGAVNDGYFANGRKTYTSKALEK
jgi:hypothetical protein